MAQAYQRLGAQVTVVAERLLLKEEPEVREVMQRVFEREGLRFLWGRAASAHRDADEIVVSSDRGEARGDLLVVGRYQFTHFAGCQAFQAVRNALLPGSSSGHMDLVPWVTFTDPEVAHVGPTVQSARMT